VLNPDQLHDYQKKASNFQSTHPHSAVWADMGLGKTAITLTSIAHLLNAGFLRGVLIVAPIRVIRLVWRQEALKWSHTKHLKFAMVSGSKDQRTRALMQKADVYLINYENLKWLADTLITYYIKKDRPIPFNGVVWDEISKMKNSTTKRVSAFRKILPAFDWTTGLTGTPAANGYKDLHGQYLVLDQGVRLGTSKTAFTERFYYKKSAYKYEAFPDTEDTIKALIGDITMQMSAEDYNPLPDLIVNDIRVDMPQGLRRKYEELEKDFFFQLDNGTDVEVFNKASLTNKCLQFSNGFVYPIPGIPKWEHIHDLKLDALEDIIEEAGGSPVLCAYSYRADAERIMERFKHLRPINLTDCKSETALNNAMSRWKNDDCALMIGHPACLHPDTQVLTKRNGWVRIVDVDRDDHVFDGVEFVSHDGCSYSGYKEVINVFGITMTPDHKILINNEWVEGQHARTNKKTAGEAIYRGKIPYTGIGCVSKMSDRSDHASPKLCKAQPGKPESLSILRGGELAPDDPHSYLPDMEGYEGEVQQSKDREGVPQLRGTWDRSLPRMGGIRELLHRYVGRIFGRSNHRENQREWSLLQGELHLGFNVRSAVKQEEQSSSHLPRGKDTSRGIGQTERVQQDDVNHEIESWYDRGRSGSGLREVALREESRSEEYETTRKAHVYDLVNCGPRHRFLIRNTEGEVFISHNSMGHGVDGLQKNGHILVWFGLNWSLDLYLQFNARIRRQGQGAPVICHRILVEDTLDQAQAMALEEKEESQTSLRNAIKKYRQMKENG